MRRIPLALAAALLAIPAMAQTQFPANTLWGNTGVTQGLPSTVPLPSCATGALNYTPGTGFGCGSGGGGGGGPLPSGVDANVLNAQTANYTIATTDCGKTIQLGTGTTGLFTLTVPSVTGFASDCSVVVVNGDTGRGKVIAGLVGIPTNILWPKQSLGIKIVNGAWAITSRPGRWQAPSPVVFNVDGASGSDSNNDCLGTGTSACASASNALSLVNNGIDFAAASGNCFVTIKIPGSLSMDASHQIATSGPFIGIANPSGASAVCIDGNGTGSLNQTSTRAAVESDYGGNIQVQNITINVPNGGTGTTVHFGGIMTLANVTFSGAATASNAVFVSDRSFLYAVGTTIGFGGTFSGAVVVTLNSSVAIFENSTINITANLTSQAFVQSQGNSAQQWSGATINLNSHTVTGAKFMTQNNGRIQGNSDGTLNFFPGSSQIVQGARNYDTLPYVDLSDTTFSVFNNLDIGHIPSGGSNGQVLSTNGAGSGTYVSQKHAFSGNSAGFQNAMSCTQNASCWFWQGSGNNANEAFVPGLIPYAGTFKNLYVQSQQAPSAGQSYTITLKVGGSTTPVTCTISGVATTCNDTTHTAAISAGQTVDFVNVSSATAASGSFYWGIELDTP